MNQNTGSRVLNSGKKDIAVTWSFFNTMETFLFWLVLLGCFLVSHEQAVKIKDGFKDISKEPQQRNHTEAPIINRDQRKEIDASPEKDIAVPRLVDYNQLKPKQASSSEGLQSWVYIAIAASVVCLVLTSIAVTILYRRHHFRKTSRQSSASKPNTLDPSIYETAHSRSTDRSTEKSKSTMSTYLSKDSREYGEDIELMTYVSLGASRERASIQEHFVDVTTHREKDVPLRAADLSISISSLPRVQVKHKQTSPEPPTTNTFIKACVGSVDSDTETGDRSTPGVLYNLCHVDDGNKLRGGNGDFNRRYERYIHYEEPMYLEKRAGRYRRYDKSSIPDHYYTQRSKPGSMNESNASSSTPSHHSIRSFICIPPTSPSENYVEAGSDDSLQRSRRCISPMVMEWLTKSIKTDAKNELGSYQSSAQTQTEGSHDTSPTCKTVFGTSWQFGGTFTARGGVMQAKNSDIALTVATNAISKGEYVDIYGAIFTDTLAIRKKFSLPQEESLITPVVEYHAENKTSFNKHLSIQLPHSLSEDFDPHSIKVYMFSVSERGKVRLECVKHLPKCNQDRNDVFWEKSQDGTSIDINTTHFSGYFCTLCESKSLPSICTMVFGSHVQITPSRREVRVILYIWDRRLTIKDYLEAFRKQESSVDRQLLTDMQVPLLDDATSDSRLLMRMETMGETIDRQCWQHVSRPNGSRPLFKPLQVRKLSEIVHCCKQTDPIRVEWALENVPQQVPGAVFQCCIDIMHVPESTTDYEAALREDNDDLMRTFYVRDLKVTSTSSNDVSSISSQEFKRVDLRRTLSDLMNTEQIENLCKEYGFAPKDIGNFRKKYSSDTEIQIGLVEECIKRFGLDFFLKQLPEKLNKLSLTDVLHQLENQKIVVNDLNDFKAMSATSYSGGNSPVSESYRRNGARFEATQQRLPCQSSSSPRQTYSDDRGREYVYTGQDRSRNPNGISVRSDDVFLPASGDRGREYVYTGQDRSRNPNRISVRSDDVFLPASGPSQHVRESFRSPEHHLYPSIPPSRDLEPNVSDRGRDDYHYGSQNIYSPHYLRRNPIEEEHAEECQPLNPQKGNSKGSDSVLRDGSLQSPYSARASTNFPSTSTEGISLLANVDSKDFQEPYPEELFTETYPKEIASNPPQHPSTRAAYPEIVEEACLTNCGPQAISPSSKSYTRDKPVSNNTRASPSHSEQTSKKELYGIGTVV